MSEAASGSEPGRTRLDVQAELVDRIASIFTCLVPDGLGVHLRFINAKLGAGADGLRMDGIRAQLAISTARSGTAIGTDLREQILDPLVYNVNTMERPLLVSIITDGVPSFEDKNRFRNEILDCRRYLRRKGLPERGKSLLETRSAGYTNTGGSRPLPGQPSGQRRVLRGVPPRSEPRKETSRDALRYGA